jgi:hypothetical protein
MHIGMPARGGGQTRRSLPMSGARDAIATAANSSHTGKRTGMYLTGFAGPLFVRTVTDLEEEIR